MHYYVFPAVFIKENSESVTAMIPDLGIVIEGPSVEESYIFLKNQLRIFCEYAVKLEEDILIPTKFEKIAANNQRNIVMLMDAMVDKNKITA